VIGAHHAEADDRAAQVAAPEPRELLPADVGRELAVAEARGLIEPDPTLIRATALGRRFLNDLQALFLAERPARKGRSS